MNRTLTTILLLAAATIPAAAQPVVTGLQNNYSYLLPGTPNFAFAQGGILVLYGINLAPTGLLAAAFNPALSPTLGGVAINVTVNGVTTAAIPYYVSPGQISAILPSATPTGTGTISVTYNGRTSAAFPIQVVPSAFGIMTMSGNGLGQAVVMDADYNLLSPLNPAREDQVVILWGTGLGADPNNETRLIATPRSLDNLPFEFYIGNKPAEVLYHGRSQYPGLDQLVVRIPKGVEGCYVSTYAKTGAYLSNFPTIPVTASGPCAEFFVSASELPALLAKPSVTAGWLYLGKFNTYDATGVTVSNAANATFLRQKPFDYTNYGSISQPSVANCVVNGFSLQNPFTAPIIEGLDAGNVSLTLPDGAVRQMARDRYGFVSSGGGSSGPLFIPASGGEFTFRGTGGTAVGAFNASIVTAPTFTWTNRASILNINRQQNLEITWTGGSPDSYVVVTGSASNFTSVVTSFACTAKTSAGRLVIPRDVLASMVPSAINPTSSVPTGQMIVFNYSLPAKFAVTGIDNPTITYYTGEVATVGYQ